MHQTIAGALRAGVIGAAGALLLGAVSGCTSAPEASQSLQVVREFDTVAAEGDARTAPPLVQRTVVFVVENPTSKPVTISRFAPTISTTVISPAGMPPLVIEPGQSIEVRVTGKNLSDQAVTRRVVVESSSGPIELRVAVEPQRAPR